MGIDGVGKSIFTPIESARNLGNRLINELEVPGTSISSNEGKGFSLSRLAKAVKKPFVISRNKGEIEKIKPLLLGLDISSNIVKKLEKKLQSNISQDGELTDEKIDKWLREVPSGPLKQFSEMVAERELIFEAQGFSRPYSELLKEMLISPDPGEPGDILQMFEEKAWVKISSFVWEEKATAKGTLFRKLLKQNGLFDGPKNSGDIDKILKIIEGVEAGEKIESFVKGLPEDSNKRKVFYKLLEEDGLIEGTKIKPKNKGDFDKILKIIKVMEKRKDGAMIWKSMADAYNFSEGKLTMHAIWNRWIPGGK